MKTAFIIAALVVASSASAAGAAPQDAMAASAASPKLTTDSKVKDLLANPKTLAVLQADIPQILANPMFKSNGSEMTLASISQFEPEALSDDNLKKIDADLAKAQK